MGQVFTALFWPAPERKEVKKTMDKAMKKFKDEINYKIAKKYAINKIDFVRPVVNWYAFRMEKRLREKDSSKGKDGWHDGKLYYYLKKTSDCLVILLSIVRAKGNDEIKEKDIHLAIKKCIDGGNFFMMLADNLRDELIKKGINL